MSLQIDYDERAISQATAFLDDPQGIRAVLDAIDRLADDPRPAAGCGRRTPVIRQLLRELPGASAGRSGP